MTPFGRRGVLQEGTQRGAAGIGEGRKHRDRLGCAEVALGGPVAEGEIPRLFTRTECEADEASAAGIPGGDSTSPE